MINQKEGKTGNALRSKGEFQYEGVRAKSIRGFPGYAVTWDGRVISFKGLKPRVLRPADNKGYLLACLSMRGKPYGRLVHRLVAQAFIPNPEGKPEVNHKDSNRKNNTAENLEWMTAKENTAHSKSGPAMREITDTKLLLAPFQFEALCREFAVSRVLYILREGGTISDALRQVPGVKLKRGFVKSLDIKEKRFLRQQGVLF